MQAQASMSLVTILNALSFNSQIGQGGDEGRAKAGCGL